MTSIRLNSPFVKQHSFVLDPELEERIKEEGSQLIDLTPVDIALESIARLPHAGAPIIRSWFATDTALCISTIVGYIVTLTLAFLLYTQVNAVQESFNKCTSGVPHLSDVIKLKQKCVSLKTLYKWQNSLCVCVCLCVYMCFSTFNVVL